MLKRYFDFINESLITGELPRDYELDLDFIKHSFEDFEIKVRIMDDSYHDNEGRLVHEGDKKYIDRTDVYVTKDIFIDGADINRDEVKSIVVKLLRRLEIDGYRVNRFNGTIGGDTINYIRLVIYPKVTPVKEAIEVPSITPIKGELPTTEYLRALTTEIEDEGVYVNFSNPIHSSDGMTVDLNRVNRLLMNGEYAGTQKRDILSRKYYLCYNVMFSVDSPEDINSYNTYINKIIKKLEHDGFKCAFYNDLGSGIKDLLKTVIIYPKVK
jgi:hypothetical protein